MNIFGSSSEIFRHLRQSSAIYSENRNFLSPRTHSSFSISILFTVNSSECEFKDKDILYRFAVDEEEGERTGDEEYTEEDLDDVLLVLSRSGPDAQLRLALRKR